MNRELPDVQDGFRKGRGTRDQIANTCWIIEKAREFQKNIYFCFIDYATAFDCVDHNKLWKILKEMGIPDTTWPASWETCIQVRKQLPGAKADQVFSPMAFLGVGSRVLAPGKQQLELDMEQHTGSN